MRDLTISKAEAFRFLLHYQHLSDAAALPDDAAIVEFVRKVGCIQFDPLDQVGKNHDLVLQARRPGYDKGGLYGLLYEDRRLFDVWDKNMAICVMEDWPYFTKNHAYMAADLANFGAHVDTVTAHLREHGVACSDDIDLNYKIHWNYSTQKLSRAVLECMCYTGRAVVHHKKGARRYYALAEQAVPAQLRQIPDPHVDEESYCRWAVLRRINSVGLMWNKGGGAFLGLQYFKGPQRNLGFAKLLENGLIAPVTVEGLKTPLYIDARNIGQLQRDITAPLPETGVRILAPLDNLLWDRDLVKALTGFDYVWEVYVPAPKRKYGYYVLPVLAGENFIGRIELATDKKREALVVKNFWWEEPVKNKRRYKSLLKKALKRFAAYNLSSTIIYEDECGL